MPELSTSMMPTTDWRTRFYRWLQINYWIFLSMPLLMLLVWSALNERAQFVQVVHQTHLNSQRDGEFYAELIHNRLTREFSQLNFIAVAISPSADKAAPSPGSVQETLSRFHQIYSDAIYLGVIAADGRTHLRGYGQLPSWTMDSNKPFVPVMGNPNLSFAISPHNSNQEQPEVSFRLKQLGHDGKVLYLIESVYRLPELLSFEFSRQPIWQFTVIDSRGLRVLGGWSDSHIDSRHKIQSSQQGARIDVKGFPLAVLVTPPDNLAFATYWENAKWRWLVYGVMFAVLSLAALGISRLLKNRDKALRRSKRLAEFSQLHAEVNQTLDRSLYEADLLSEVCTLAIKHSGLKLAYVARPNVDGWFEFVAAAGATGYLNGLQLSTDPDVSAGQSVDSQAWRQEKAYFNDDFYAHPELSPWANQANKFGFQSSAALPINKYGEIWAVLSVFHCDKNIFDADLQTTLRQLAQDITYGLHWIDLQRQEEQLLATQTALLTNTVAGIALLKNRHIAQINPRFSEILGYEDESDLIGVSTEILYENQQEYMRVTAAYQDLHDQKQVSVNDVRMVRHDGRIVIVDMSGSLIQGESDDLTVWTIEDITLRHHLQAELSQSLAFQKTLFEKNAAAMFIVDQEMILQDVNPAMCVMMGVENPHVLIGQNVRTLFGDDAEFEIFLSCCELNHSGASEENRAHMRLQRSDQRRLKVEMLGSSIALPGGESAILWSVVDVTALYDAKEAVIFQANHDALTGLPNRRALEQRLPHALARALRSETVVAIGVMDLDDFKPVNDTYGHAAGDTLLKLLGERLKSRLRATDFIARLGGDEFVFIFENINSRQVQTQLDTLLSRLHEAVETPFEVLPSKWAKIDVSMGISLFPQDAEAGKDLLQYADNALYAAKSHKVDRRQWWWLHHRIDERAGLSTDVTNDAFSLVSRKLLRQNQEIFEQITPKFVTRFYHDLNQNQTARAILDALSEHEREALVHSQSLHLLFILGPDTTREQIYNRAEIVGTVHALVGVSSVLLMQSMSLYRKLLTEYMSQSPLSARDRYRLLTVTDVRIEEDILTQAEIGAHITQHYFELLGRPLPSAGSLWADAIPLELLALGECPGVQASLLIRSDPQGRITIESSSGRLALDSEPLIDEVESLALQDVESVFGSSWQSGQVRTINLIQNKLKTDPLTEAALKLQIKSIMVVPIMGQAGVVTAGVVVLGAYPNQFESIWMQQFSLNLQRRLSQIWMLCASPDLVMNQHLVSQYREALFNGGLKLYMQPIVDLHTGQLFKVEALTRMQLPSGELIAPNQFLPFLGNSELDRLFCNMLDETLAQLAKWSEIGFIVNAAVNLPPSTLLDVNCPLWIESALKKHRIEPARLTLEILETHEFNHEVQDTAIQRIVALGVPLAMDDLGAGYSSLQRLATLPFQIMKIDQALLANIRNNPIQAMSLIAAIIQMGRDFDQFVVVEGLEDEATIEASRILGARYGQGYALSRPMPADQIPDWLATVRPPQDSNRIRTFMGAMAFHWWFMHNGNGSHPDSELTCPLHQFLIEQAEASEEVLQWHHEIHHASDNRQASRQLMGWLAARI